MLAVSDIRSLRQVLEAQNSVVLVPTMGNLHEGHLALVKLARQRASYVVVSIFVNPLQFAVHEDFDRYPRTLEEDKSKLGDVGVDIVFTPTNSELFPQPQRFYLELPTIADDLCGKFRPGHFRGVATVVLKLFNIVQPQAAVFGKKDYQQLHIVQRLVSEFNLPTEIIAGETTRAADGLALSSRNFFLNESERDQANALYKVLSELKSALVKGAQDFSRLEESARMTLIDLGWRVDYVSVRNTTDLSPATTEDKALVIMGAAWLGKTRLIDNVEFEL